MPNEPRKRAKRSSSRPPVRKKTGIVMGSKTRKSMDTELSRLRSVFKDIVDAYASKVEGRILQLQEVIREQSGGKRREESLQKLLSSVRGTKTKPEKGRLRDIKEIHNLVREIQRKTETW